MALSASTIPVASPVTSTLRKPYTATGGLHSLTLVSPARSTRSGARCVEVCASAAPKSMKEKAVSVATAAAMAAALAVPQVAEAAGPGISPSLKNFLLSIVAGGVVLTVIVGAVIGVANFDPVKRS